MSEMKKKKNGGHQLRFGENKPGAPLLGLAKSIYYNSTLEQNGPRNSRFFLCLNTRCIR